jgi:hypothetical protein
VPPTPPVLEEVTPRAGRVALVPGDQGSFRCRARVPAARPGDRLAFEWMLDDRPMRREEQPAADATSDLVVPASDAGGHHLRLRVTEDGRSASIAEWAIAVVSAEAPAPRLVPAPGPRSLEGHVGEPLVFQTRVEPESTDIVYDWTLDGRSLQARTPGRLVYPPRSPGRYTIGVAVAAAGRTIGRDTWFVTVREPGVTWTLPPAREPARPVAAAVPPLAAAPPPVAAAAPPPEPPTTAALAEAEVRAWLDEYARAWSRKDLSALRRMGQVRSAAEEQQLERYFRSVDDLHVAVRVLALRLDGARASVELERTDTVTDPSGRRQELRLPPIRKQIERTPDGLRFTGDGGPG